MYVIGTAGHVDHGKSTLVEALTGIDPDRLAEEKAREMTIDLGFAWLNLSDSEVELQEVGVVDVPGHRDFIENMLAGVGGIDLALLVVAADEGVMPQTQEHLAILDLLGIQGGVVALTKVDLIDDPDWLELVILDLSETLAGTVLEDAPIIPVSAKTGRGLPILKRTVGEGLLASPPRPDKDRPRLAVDRVFSLSGFGTVVTGTLVGGSLQVGDSVEIHPAGTKARVRGLQTHKTKREIARPGSRVAINLSGLDKEGVKRGDMIARPGLLRQTILLDAEYRHLATASQPLKHNAEVKFFVGATEIIARTRVLGAPHINPGETGWLQLALRSPAALLRGDKFILRQPSPGATIGGGRVLEPHPGRKHRRFRPQIIERLQTLAQGDPSDILLQALARVEPITQSKLFKQVGMEADVVHGAWNRLREGGQVVEVGQNVLQAQTWQRYGERGLAILQTYHTDFPLRQGMPREELRSRLGLSAGIFNPLVTQLTLQEAGAMVALPAHAIRFTPEQTAQTAALEQRLTGLGVNSLSVKACKAAVGDEVYLALIELGQLVQISGEVVYPAGVYESLIKQIITLASVSGRVNVAQVRDLFNTSRKYAIALLEHLDERKITRRVGDDRELLISK